MCPRALPLPAAVVVDVSVAAQYAMPVGRRTRAARRVERRVAVFLLARVTGNVAIAVAVLVISTATRVTRTLSRRRRIFFVVVATSVGETRFTCLPLLLRELFYITAITIANPLVTSSIEKRAGGAVGTAWGLLGSFSVGCTAGLDRSLYA